MMVRDWRIRMVEPRVRTWGERLAGGRRPCSGRAAGPGAGVLPRARVLVPKGVDCSVAHSEATPTLRRNKTDRHPFRKQVLCGETPAPLTGPGTPLRYCLLPRGAGLPQSRLRVDRPW